MGYQPRKDKDLLLTDLPDKDEIVVVEHPYVEADQTTLIEWTLGNTCNYSCSYCPEELHSGTKKWIDFSSVKSFISRIHNYYCEELDRDIWLQYTGGEPTLYPEIVELLDYTHGKGIKQSMITNGSRSLRFWEKVHPFLTTVHLTFHVEKADKDHFTDVIDFLYGKCNLHINLTMKPERFDEVFEFSNQIRSRFDKMTMSLKPLRINFGKDLYDYTEDQLQKIRDGLPPPQKMRDNFCRSFMVLTKENGNWFYQKANPLIVNGYNAWKGWNCLAGIESLVIMSDGQILKSMCGVDGVIGKITDEHIEFPRDWTKCPNERCRCVTDILITKRKFL